MATIVQIRNVFKKGGKETVVTEHPGGCTIRDWLSENMPLGFKEFIHPTICVFNGKPLLRKDWSTQVIGKQDVVNFIAVPGWTALIYLVVGLLIAAVAYVTLSVAKPTIPGQLPEPDPVFDLKGQKNQIRLGSPIEVAYGRNRLFPSYAARPYSQFIGNQQFQFQLFCLGQGEFDIEEMRIEDTPVDNFQDVTVEVYGPGEEVTLFPDNVITSVEVSGIELFATNEPEYVGMSGPFVANAAGTQTTKLEVDVVLPNGLYRVANNGSLLPKDIYAQFDYREIDDMGAPISGWVGFTVFAQVLSTNTPQRFTISQDVTAGRYEVRGYRTDLKDSDSKTANTVRWDSLRAFLPDTKDYGDVTLVALKAKASNNLNDRASNRFNVIATRKLPIYDPETETFSAPTATRGIVPAFMDLMRAEYGGRLDNQYIALAELAELDEIFEARNWHFDWIFDQRLSLWEAAQVIARAGRSAALLDISQVTLSYDYAKTVPTAMFNQENIIAGSLKWDITFARLEEYDGIEVEYVDPVKFTRETVKCLVGDDAGENCEQIKFPGCQSRERAYEEGMYLRRSKITNRDNISFETGVEGRIVKKGELVRFSHDVPRWGQGGLVLSISGTTVTCNEPLDWGDMMGTFKIGFRAKNGDLLGSYTVTPGAEPNQAELAAPIDDSTLNLGGNAELPLFYFGKENLETKLLKIVEVIPGDSVTANVSIKAIIADNSIYDSDGIEPDPVDPPVVPPTIPKAPVLNCASVTLNRDPFDPTKYRMSWAPALGATSYNVQRSADAGTNWVDVGNTSATYMDLLLTDGEDVIFRVQPVGAGTGPWCIPETGPGSEDDPNPPGDDKYYWSLLQLIAPLSLTISCKIQSGVAQLVGFGEFVSPSVPPRYYRTMNAGGSGFCDDDKVYAPDRTLNCTSGSVANSSKDTWSGQFTHDVDTGVYQNNSSHCSKVSGGPVPCGTISFGPGDCNTFGSTNIGDLFGDPPSFAGFPLLKSGGPDVESQRLNISWSLEGDCVNIGSPGSEVGRTLYDGEVTIQLTEEDTEDDAINRLKNRGDPGDFVDWGTIDWTPCAMFPCCEVSYEERTSGFLFDWGMAKVRIEATGLTNNGFCTIRVHVWRRNLLTNLESLLEIKEFETYADALGGIDEEFDLEPERGYAVYVKKVTFHQLAA